MTLLGCRSPWQRRGWPAGADSRSSAPASDASTVAADKRILLTSRSRWFGRGTGRTHRIGVLGLEADPARGRRRMWDLDDRATTIGVDRGARAPRHEVTKQPGHRANSAQEVRSAPNVAPA